MSCFPCFQNTEEDDEDTVNEEVPIANPKDFTQSPPGNNGKDDAQSTENLVPAKIYTFREVASATKNFRSECLLGEGGFGRVFKGTLTQSGLTVAIRQLDRNGVQASTEFSNEVTRMSLLQHPNLVKITGYCADGEQRILVYEYMPSGSLKNHLFDLPEGTAPLDWSTRMKIALGIAEGLEFLHEKANPPIIYRDLKSSNILLDASNNPKLSEYGLAKLVQTGDGSKMHVAPRVMGGYGYGAPEYETHGELTLKSDVYSFGVVLLELITGRKAMDTDQPTDDQNLVSWAQPLFRDPSKFPDMADPLLQKKFPVTGLNQAVGVAAMCLQEEPMARPLISDISAALSFLAMAPPEAPVPARLVPILSSRVATTKYTSFKEEKNQTDDHHTPKKADQHTPKKSDQHTPKKADQHTPKKADQHTPKKADKHDHKKKKDDSSDSEDDDDDHVIHAKHDEKSSSDYDYEDDNTNTDSSDDEANKKSKKLGSSSKCKSKKKSLSKKSSGGSYKSRSRSSSLSSSPGSSRDYSIGFSLRSDSAFPERSESSVSRHDDHHVVEHYNHNDGSSSSDDESGNESEVSNSEKFHERVESRRSYESEEPYEED